MTGSSDNYHEPYEELQPQTTDMHRALVSLMEELEAIDWYQQRMDATRDEELRAILAHNKEEEAEHAMMTLEWLRRHSNEIDHHAREYLFTEGSIAEHEHSGQGASSHAGSAAGSGSLGIGSLRQGD